MRSIKVVGISGTGKSTLISAVLRRYPGALHLSFGDFLRQHGDAAAVERAWDEALAEGRPLYLIDEHLEFGVSDLVDTYRRERTVGMIFLGVSSQSLLVRRASDSSRKRNMDIIRAEYEHLRSFSRAVTISGALRVPLVILHDADLPTSIAALDRLIHLTG